MSQSPSKNDNPELLFRIATWYKFSGQLLAAHAGWRAGRVQQAGRRRVEIPNWIMPTAIPGVVVSAFCLELYLKCLTWITIGRPARKRTLQSLFGSLPGARQHDIGQAYADCFKEGNSAAWPRLPEAGPDGTPYDKSYYDFTPSLARISSAFEDWRHFYETGSRQCLEFGVSEQVTHAVERAILKLKPEWQAILDELGSVPGFVELHPHS